MYTFALLVVVALVLATGEAQAQCGAKTSECKACHAHVDDEAWHRDHAFADLCVSCHGGNGDAKDEASAHAAMQNARATCKTCHPGSATYERPSAPPPRPPPPRRPAPHVNRANVALAAGVVALATIALASRARRWLRGPTLAGAALGVVATISLAVFGKRLSGAGAYQHLSGYVGRSLAPNDVYWTYVVPTGVTWEVWTLIGTFAGALGAALVAREFSIRAIPERGWADAFGPSIARRWLVVFVGTMLLEWAAGIAGGCTASLAVSGGAVLAPAAYLFMLGMFAGGIPVAMLVGRRRKS